MTVRGYARIVPLLWVGMLLAGMMMLPAVASAQDAAPAAAAEVNNPLKDLLDKTGLKYKKLDDESWIVPFDAKEGETLDVYLTYNDSNRKFALVFSTVVDKEDNYNFPKEALVEAMKLNNDFPGVKFCLDIDHGDIDVQTEALMQTLTPETLTMFVNLVAQMADDNAKKLNDLVR